MELSAQGAVPDTAQAEFVNIVVLCATGNQYGYSWAAEPHYVKIIKNFSPREVALMLEAATKYQPLALRIKYYAACRNRFRDLVKLIDEKSVPTSQKAAYQAWLA